MNPARMGSGAIHQPPPSDQPQAGTPSSARSAAPTLGRARPADPKHSAKTGSLHEIHATGGEVCQLCDLLGLIVSGATRHLATIEPPDRCQPP